MLERTDLFQYQYTFYVVVEPSVRYPQAYPPANVLTTDLA
jgi:hypothetical protein